MLRIFGNLDIRIWKYFPIFGVFCLKFPSHMCIIFGLKKTDVCKQALFTFKTLNLHWRWLFRNIFSQILICIQIATCTCCYIESTFFLPFAKQNQAEDFKSCWSFCFELKLLSGSKYSMPQVLCAFGNVYIWDIELTLAVT